MPIDPAEGLVQEMSDWRFKYTFYANTEPVCDVCGEKVHDVIEMKGAEGSDVIQACFNWRRDCFQTAWDKLYDLEPEASYLLARMIKYRPILYLAHEKLLWDNYIGTGNGSVAEEPDAATVSSSPPPPETEESDYPF